jgi:hypothetical protein
VVIDASALDSIAASNAPTQTAIERFMTSQQHTRANSRASHHDQNPAQELSIACDREQTISPMGRVADSVAPAVLIDLSTILGVFMHSVSASPRSLPSKRTVRASLACAFTVMCLASALRAQDEPLSSFDLALVRDTGWVENTAQEPRIVASFVVSVPGAASLRLGFSEIALAGDVARHTGSKIRMVSLLDGGTQELDALQCREWRNASCYFNGDAVEVEIVAEPGTGANHALLSEVVVGLVPVQAQTQCGDTDDRVPSHDARVARVLPIGCTTWLINDCTHCFLTAGHCGAGIGVIEFNVPPSTPQGALQHPAPEDQYAPDPASLQYMNGGQGNDWAYYGCFPNPITGLTPFERQQAAFVMAPSAASIGTRSTLRVTGYGTDSTALEYNQVQQTATGPSGPTVGTIVQYSIDTTGGGSGSPVIFEDTGLAIGIHTNGGCIPSAVGLNSGTSVDNQHLQDALANPLGVCAGPCSPEMATYCIGKRNSQGCTPSIGTLGIPRMSGGPGSFVIRAHSVINHKAGMLMYGMMSDHVPFMGGVLCIASPIVRTTNQSSGGNPGADDCSGSLVYDMGSRIAAGEDPNLHVGATAYAQYWFRDPSSQPFGVGLSDAVRFTIVP